MEIANVYVAIGGDKGNLVPKYCVTAAEVAVLRMIHGDDAVVDIEITGEVKNRTHRQEIARLSQAYGRQEGERRVSPAVDRLYPGAAARVFETFAELEIPDEFYKAASRKTARPAAPRETVAEQSLSDLTVNELRARADKMGVDLAGITKKADIIEALETAEQGDEPDEDDGTGDMDDEIADKNLFK